MDIEEAFLKVSHDNGGRVTGRTVGLGVSGFTFALQIWAYEVMPFVAAYCASRAHDFNKETPLILRWHATKTPLFRDLQEIFTSGDKACLLSKPLNMPAEMDLSKKGKTEDFSEPAAAVKDDQGKEPEMRGTTCSDGHDDNVILISDSSDDEAPDADHDVGDDSDFIVDEQDSDDDSCSDSKPVATIQSRKKRQKKDI